MNAASKGSFNFFKGEKGEEEEGEEEDEREEGGRRRGRRRRRWLCQFQAWLIWGNDFSHFPCIQGLALCHDCVQVNDTHPFGILHSQGFLCSHRPPPPIPYTVAHCTSPPYHRQWLAVPLEFSSMEIIVEDNPV